MELQESEFQGSDLNFLENQELDEGGRSKSALRMKYEAEMTVLRQKLGSLEDIRKKLGLSQRKMAQLLMVDPSAWTRWLKNESKVPPHIYRSLQWYLELVDKKPEWHPQNSFHPYPGSSIPEGGPQWEVLKEEMNEQMGKMRSHSNEFVNQMRQVADQWAQEKQDLVNKIEKKDMTLMVWKMFVLLNSVVILFWLVWQVL